MGEISKDLHLFIQSYLTENSRKPLLINLTSETEVENDLEITGDDADPFLTALVKKFNLDYSKFDGRKYFGYEHEKFDFFFPVLRLFFGNRKWLPLPKNKRTKLTLGMIDDAILKGELA